MIVHLFYVVAVCGQYACGYARLHLSGSASSDEFWLSLWQVWWRMRLVVTRCLCIWDALWQNTIYRWEWIHGCRLCQYHKLQGRDTIYVILFKALQNCLGFVCSVRLWINSDFLVQGQEVPSISSSLFSIKSHLNSVFFSFQSTCVYVNSQDWKSR